MSTLAALKSQRPLNDSEKGKDSISLPFGYPR